MKILLVSPRSSEKNLPVGLIIPQLVPHEGYPKHRTMLSLKRVVQLKKPLTDQGFPGILFRR
ncbi:MAG: hypothetical protein WBB37_04615 [bacterium]